jgi:hypothetical protein
MEGKPEVIEGAEIAKVALSADRKASNAIAA